MRTETEDICIGCSKHIDECDCIEGHKRAVRQFANSIEAVRGFYDKYGESFTQLYIIQRPFPEGVSLKDVIVEIGINMGESPQSSYSPTGRWFHHRADIERTRRFVIISQRFGLDV